MNVMRNFEGYFLVAVALACATAYAAAEPQLRAPSQVAVSGGKMVAVSVTAKRLTPAQKASPAP